jgi:MOSC domain-containing protein YiiM
MDLPLLCLLAGPVAPLGPKAVPSAIAKVPVDGPVRIGTLGIDGDSQADRRNHGGPDKAVHHYPADHAAAWRRELPAPVSPLIGQAGGFGENISTLGVTEGDICLGDVFRAGSAVLQVSQGRQPCWKLNLRFAVPDMAKRVQQSGRTGWYYRVLEDGVATAGDRLRLIDRPHGAWPLTRLQGIFYGRAEGAEALRALAALPVLAESWRTLARRRLDSGTVEDWTPRLTGGSG